MMSSKLINNCIKPFLQVFLVGSFVIPSLCSASDDGPRMYWNGPVGLNIMQVYTLFIRGNSISTNNNMHEPNLDGDMELMLLEYDHIFDLAGDSFLVTAMLPLGQVEAQEFNLFNQSTSGLGDLYFQGVYNIIGAPALSMSEFADYKQNTMVSLLMGVTLPTGRYDNHSLLNMGENRWALRTGVSYVQSLGEWVPGKITTLEILPSAWFYSSNDDFLGNNKLTQDTLYTVEAHLTRDITQRSYISLDYAFQSGGETAINGINQNDEQQADFLGLTLGYQFSESSMLTLRYSSTLNPDPSKELDVDTFQLNVNYMW